MRIGEVAQRIGVSREWIRRQERAGLISRAARDQNGQRRYRDEEVEDLLRLLFRSRPEGGPRKVANPES